MPRRTVQPVDSRLSCGSNEVVMIFRIHRRTPYVSRRDAAECLQDACFPFIVLEPVGIGALPVYIGIVKFAIGIRIELEPELGKGCVEGLTIKVALIVVAVIRGAAGV